MCEVNRVCFWVCKYVMLTYTIHAFLLCGIMILKQVGFQQSVMAMLWKANNIDFQQSNMSV